MTLLFATRTDSRFGTDSLYPDYQYELTVPKQMLARPEVPSWQQYNFAGSMTMVFASGSARALFDEDATPCAPSVLSANRKLGALWLGLCMIVKSLADDRLVPICVLGFGNPEPRSRCEMQDPSAFVRTHLA